MRRIQKFALVMVALAVAGCAEGRYPVSGETCGPRDPVKTLDANDCKVLPGS